MNRKGQPVRCKAGTARQAASDQGSGLGPLQPDPGAPAVLGDELDPCGFKGGLDFAQSIEADPDSFGSSRFHVADGVDADCRKRGNVGLFHPRKGASCFELISCHLWFIPN